MVGTYPTKQIRVLRSNNYSAASSVSYKGVLNLKIQDKVYNTERLRDNLTYVFQCLTQKILLMYIKLWTMSPFINKNY